MKTTFFILCFLCATAALGQSVGGAALSNEPQPIQFLSHPQHASRQPMAQEHNILDGSDYVYAQGERPLWEMAPVSHETPLGDVARILRKEHTMAKKADIVWSN
jgi:hypothetical protein